MTVIDEAITDATLHVSVAHLNAMLDGGDDDDWIPVVKLRADGPPGNRVVRMRVLSPDGQQIIPDLVGRSGDKLKLTYCLEIDP